jgi:hypothetical protein
MNGQVAFPYIRTNPSFGPAGFMPILPVELRMNRLVQSGMALLNSGSPISVIPYQLGLQLGANWNQYSASLPMGGGLANYTAKPLFVDVMIHPFVPVQLAFAWSQAPAARLLFGQVNFFQEFDVCFFRSRGEFQIQPATP